MCRLCVGVMFGSSSSNWQPSYHPWEQNLQPHWEPHPATAVVWPDDWAPRHFSIDWVTVVWQTKLRLPGALSTGCPLYRSTEVSNDQKPRSPRTFIARVRRSEKVKSMGRHSPPLMSLLIKNGGLPMAGRPECMKSPPSLCSHRIRAKNGKL